MKKRFLTRALVSALVVAAGASATLVGTTINSPAAEAATNRSAGISVPKGAHYPFSGDVWLGSYSIDGGPDGYCIDYAKGTPDGGAGKVTGIPGWAVGNFQAMAYVTNAWGNTNDPKQAAAVYLAINWFGGDPAFVADYRATYRPHLLRTATGKQVIALLDKFVAQAKSQHGPYAASVRVTQTALPGAVGTAVVSVTSTATRKGISSLPIAVGLANATPASALPGRLDAAGNATVKLRPTREGRVDVGFTTSSLVNSSDVLLSRPSTPDRQRVALVSASPRQSVRASASFTSTYPGNGAPTVAVSCTSDCEGKPPVTITYSKNTSAVNMRAWPILDGVARKDLFVDVAPGKTAAKTFVGRDGMVVTSWGYAYGTTGNWSTDKRGSALNYVVVCPPKPVIEIDCLCVTGKATERNTTSYWHRVLIGAGGQERVVVVAPGATAELGALPRGQQVTIKVLSYRTANPTATSPQVGPTWTAATVTLG